MKTRSETNAYIVRSSAAALLLSCVIVALCSAINLPNPPPKGPTPDNNTAFAVNEYDRGASMAAPAIRKRPTLSFADRVAYQRVIEQVYWRHRIWPAENATAKPSLDKVMSQAQIEKKVEDYLHNSQALENYWQRPITAEQLQAEMDRMAQHTKQPEVLRELFQALGDDPFVIAECLARPTLAVRTLATVASFKEPLPASQFRVENQMPDGLAVAAARYTLPTISNGATGCIDDTWRPNAPDGRQGHTSVWTGSEMIVWGGQGVGGYLNTGGRYNPATDNWLTM